MKTFATPKLLIGIAAVMGGIYAADQFLARLEQRELGAEARHLYQSGEDLVHAGRYAGAIDALQRAHFLDRDNDTYTLALAGAMIADHQPQRAVEALTEILDEDSNDGQANLLMARAMSEEGESSGADSYYHRAVYGTWPDGGGPGGAAAERVRARVELAHWLAQRGDAKELLAESILLEDPAKSDPRLARELPALYERAGSSYRAIEAYRELIRASPGDADAYSGLGHAEMEAGDFHAAALDFERAARIKPEDAALERDERLAAQALALDPTPRRLSSAEKLARANGVLRLAADAAVACVAGQSGWETDSPLFRSAYSLTRETKTPPTNESAEVRLDYALRIWNSRPATCNSQRGRPELLDVLIRKIAQ